MLHKTLGAVLWRSDCFICFGVKKNYRKITVVAVRTGLGRLAKRWMGLAERWEGTKRSHLNQSGERLLNAGGGWRSVTFKAVNEELEKEVRKFLLVSMVGAEAQAALGRVSSWAAGGEGLADKAVWPQQAPEIPPNLRSALAPQALLTPG